MADAERVEGLVVAWSKRDHARALVPGDHAAIDATTAARALVVEHVLRGAHADLFHACLVLGRLLAEHGGSPTLAAATMDGVIGVAFGDLERRRGTDDAGQSEWIISARAALAEGFGAARWERARREHLAAWDFPRCAVRVDKDTMAFAAGIPDQDHDVLVEWAGRVAAAALRARVRRALVDGPEAAKHALSEALDLAGIEIVTPRAEGGSIFKLPWLRR